MDNDAKKDKMLQGILKRKNERFEKIKKIDSSKEVKWQEKSTGDLRTYLYANGFKLDDDVKFVQFSRSSSKSRKGEVLFIKETLLKNIQKWIRLGFTIRKNESVDLVSLRAYESLIGSGIESTVKIGVENIFITNDLQSKFKLKDEINVVRTDSSGKLGVVKEKDYEITNDIWDGQSLMDYNAFFKDKDYSFMLLRNHMFKSAGFSFDIQGYLQDYHDKYKPTEHYDDWEIEDRYGVPMSAKDILMVTTPNSCKFLKFAYLTTPNNSFIDFKNRTPNKQMYYERKMYEHWKDEVIKDGEIFGICKHEKESTHSFYDDSEDSVHRLSYQIINTLPADEKSISILMKDEQQYIKKLQNNENELFIDYLEKTSSDLNSNHLYSNLYHINDDIQYTQMFKDYKSTTINKYKSKLKRGNIRVNDIDYCIMCSNPIEMMESVINKTTSNDLKAIALKGDQIYTKLFPFGEKVVGCRNPHTATSNYYKSKNTYNSLIDDYMKHMSKNIVIVNSIETLIMEILSGCDYDSDSQLLMANKCIRYVTKGIEKDFLPVVSGIKPDKTNSYIYSPAQMAEADEKISRSAATIGMVANLGQLAQSVFQDLKANGEVEKEKKVLDLVSQVVALSTVCIDLAKKSFKVKIESEISSIRNALNAYIQDKEEYFEEGVKKTRINAIYKPKFFKEIEKKKIEKERKKGTVRKVPVIYKDFKTPMDYLQKQIKLIGNSDRTDTIPLADLLNKDIKLSDSNNNQIPKFKEMITNINAEFSPINKDTSKDDMEEKMMRANELMSKYKNELSGLVVNAATIKSLINRMYIEDKDSDFKIDENSKMLNLLLCTHYEEFSKVFAKKGVKF